MSHKQNMDAIAKYINKNARAAAKAVREADDPLKAVYVLTLFSKGLSEVASGVTSAIITDMEEEK